MNDKAEPTPPADPKSMTPVDLDQVSEIARVTIAADGQSTPVPPGEVYTMKCKICTKQTVVAYEKKYKKWVKCQWCFNRRWMHASERYRNVDGSLTGHHDRV